MSSPSIYAEAVPKQPTKKSWSQEEDSQLITLIEVHGIKNWSTIAQLLPNRIGKQCRERWFNHLDPNIKKGEWTEEEDDIIITQQKLHGNQWSKITKLLPGRTDNSVKNRWHATWRAKQRSDSISGESRSRAMSYDAPEVDTEDNAVVIDNVFPVYETSSPQVASAYYSDSDLYLEDAEYSTKNQPTITVTSPKAGRMSVSSQESGLGWLVYPKKQSAGDLLSPVGWVENLTSNALLSRSYSDGAMQTQSDMTSNESFVAPISETSMLESGGFDSNGAQSQHFILCPSPRKPSIGEDYTSNHQIHKRHIFSPDMMAAEDQYCMDVESLPQAMELCLSPPLDRITIYSPETMLPRGIQFDHCM